MIIRCWFLFSLGDLRKHLVPKSGDYPSIAQKHFNGAVASLIFHCVHIDRDCTSDPLVFFGKLACR